MRSNIYLDLCETTPPIVREGKAKPDDTAPRRVREEAVVSIWMEQPWGAYPVRDVRGKMVEIISPGWIKGGAGPDFRDALFRYDNGDVEKGDVEIHVRSSDWLRHKHFRDPAYNDTRLHVVGAREARPHEGSIASGIGTRSGSVHVVDCHIGRQCHCAIEFVGHGIIGVTRTGLLLCG